MPQKIKSVILTGCTGGIGVALVNECVRRGMEVWAVCRPQSARIAHLPQSASVHVVECDIADYASLHGAGIAADAFVHLAWEKTFGAGRDDLDCQLKNVQYTLDAVRLARACGCKVFVGAGSQAEYGIKSEPLRGDTPVDPQSGYGIAKYAAGKFSRNLCAQYGIRHCWVRILSAFGLRDGKNTLISYLLDTLLSGGTPELTPCGQVWDYLYFTDAAKAFASVLEKGRDGAVYPLGSGMPRKLKEYVCALRDLAAPQAELKFGAKEYYPHQPMVLAADISELTADTGWAPEMSFEDGIREMLKAREV